MTGRATSVDAATLLAVAGAAADAARAVVKPYFRAQLTADAKIDESPVTIADRQAEAAIRAVISARLPDHGILGEEYGVERPGARYQWVIDPIDGTRAFITGRLTFGTLLGLYDGDVPLLGVIDQPITEERWVGFEGRPTLFAGPFAGRVGTRPCPQLSLAELSATSPDIFDAQTRPAWRHLASQVRRTSWGGDCYAYGLLALGQIDLVVEAGMKVWDWAALQCIVRGAGGLISDWQGRALSAGSDGRVLAAGDPVLHALAVECLAASAPAGVR